MFYEALLRCLLLLTAVLLPAHAFWWAPPTAAPTTRSDCSSESPLAVKEIPLTYFRTYTYQPIAGHPFAAFPYYHHAAGALQSPLLADPARYAHGAYMQASAYPMSVALPQQPQPQSMPPQMYQLSQTPVLQVKPLPSPTTTTSTTEPPTTTSTSTTTTTTTTTPPPPPSSTPASTSTSTTTSASVTQATEVHALPQQQQPQPQPYPYPYPTYNRRAYMGYNPHSYRPAYPYPDYTVYKTAPVTRFNSHGGQIQFVPCMCPVSVGSGAVRSSLTPEGRTTSDEEEDLMVLARADELSLPVELSVGTEKTQPETAVADRPKSETEVLAKTGAESELSENLLQKATETAEEQLSTNKLDEQSRDAMEPASAGKHIDA